MTSAPGWRRAVLAGALTLHLAVLYTPQAPSPGPGVAHLDKVAHVAVFLLVVWAARGAGLGVRRVAVLAAAHALVSELLQGLVLPDRSGDPVDVVADLAGVGLGVLLPTGRSGTGRSGRGRRADGAGGRADGHVGGTIGG